MLPRPPGEFVMPVLYERRKPEGDAELADDGLPEDVAEQDEPCDNDEED